MAIDPVPGSKLAICIRNEGYEASLERRKLYQIVDDPVALKDGLLRVIDESGDDYLYPHAFFVHVDLPKPVEQAVIEAA